MTSRGSRTLSGRCSEDGEAPEKIARQAGVWDEPLLSELEPEGEAGFIAPDGRKDRGVGEGEERTSSPLA